MFIRKNCRKAFTLIESLVVLAIFSAAISLLYFQWISSRKSGKKLTRAQRYYNTRALLQARLRRDMRSAVGLEEMGNSEYRVTVLSKQEDGNLVYEDIHYRRPSDKVVLREDTKKSRTYDFTDLIETEILLKLSKDGTCLLGRKEEAIAQKVYMLNLPESKKQTNSIWNTACPVAAP